MMLNMFTAGTDVLGCSKSDRLWFLLKGRNQSLFYLPISASVGSCCQHMGDVAANFWSPGPEVDTSWVIGDTLKQMTWEFG